jgi:hypothetical protein
MLAARARESGGWRHRRTERSAAVAPSRPLARAAGPVEARRYSKLAPRRRWPRSGGDPRAFEPLVAYIADALNNEQSRQVAGAALGWVGTERARFEQRRRGPASLRARAARRAATRAGLRRRSAYADARRPERTLRRVRGSANAPKPSATSRSSQWSLYHRTAT